MAESRLPEQGEGDPDGGFRRRIQREGRRRVQREGRRRIQEGGKEEGGVDPEGGTKEVSRRGATALGGEFT